MPAVILDRAFRQLDKHDSPNYPGKMYWSTIEATLRRFDSTSRRAAEPVERSCGR